MNDISAAIGIASLLCAFLIVDFIVWPLWARLSAGRTQRSPSRTTSFTRPSVWYSTIHGMAALAAISYTGRPTSGWFWAVLAAGLIASLALNRIRRRASRSRSLFYPNANALLVDGLVGGLVVVAVAIFLWPPSPSNLGAIQMFLEQGRAKAVYSALIILVGVFVGGLIVETATRPLAANLQKHELDVPTTPAEVGRYIGWLERLLIILVIGIKVPEAIGLLLAAKSLARFPELRNATFAEYFLIGTLLSVTIALLAGILLVRVLHQTWSIR